MRPVPFSDNAEIKLIPIPAPSAPTLLSDWPSSAVASSIGRVRLGTQSTRSDNPHPAIITIEAETKPALTFNRCRATPAVRMASRLPSRRKFLSVRKSIWCPDGDRASTVRYPWRAIAHEASPFGAIVYCDVHSGFAAIVVARPTWPGQSVRPGHATQTK